MHICISKLTIIDSNNGLLPGRRQYIIWTNDRIFLIEPLGTNLSEILIDIDIHIFSFNLEDAFKNVCNMATILSRTQYVQPEEGQEATYVCNKSISWLLMPDGMWTKAVTKHMVIIWYDLLHSMMIIKMNLCKLSHEVM